jgi:hypothetical protein
MTEEVKMARRKFKTIPQPRPWAPLKAFMIQLGCWI